MYFNNIRDNLRNNFRDNFSELTPLLPFHIEEEHIQPTCVSVSSQHTSLPRVLTHQLYLDVRRKNIEKQTSFFNYLNFTNKTYYTHWKSLLYNSWLCTKASFYFFVQAWHPDIFQHYAPDIIIKLSENILDEYSNSINNRADQLI